MIATRSYSKISEQMTSCVTRMSTDFTAVSNPYKGYCVYDGYKLFMHAVQEISYVYVCMYAYTACLAACSVISML